MADRAADSDVARSILNVDRRLDRNLDDVRQARRLELDRYLIGAQPGHPTDSKDLAFRALDEEPVAEVFDERAIRIPLRDVREEKDAAAFHEAFHDDADEKRRHALVEVVEQTASHDQIELRLDTPCDAQ